jgi:hypothetical protein
MAVFRPLPVGLARKLIEGIQDELTPLAESRAGMIKSRPCPRCKNAMHPFLNSQHAFSPNDPLPRLHARCTECGLEWDPVSNLILNTGDPSKVTDPVPIIRPRDPA